MNPSENAHVPAPLHDGTHIQESEPRDDGSFRALTIFDKGSNGVLVWAGYVVPGQNTGPDGDINPGFVVTERVSFMFWEDVWRYFRDREFSRLIAKFRIEKETTIGAG